MMSTLQSAVVSKEKGLSRFVLLFKSNNIYSLIRFKYFNGLIRTKSSLIIIIRGVSIILSQMHI